MLLSEVSRVSSDEPDYRLRHVRDQAAGGLSVAEYCRRHGLCAATFYRWRRQLPGGRGRRPGPPAGGGEVSFTEISRVAAARVVPAAQAGPWAAEIALPSGAVVRVGAGADARLVRAVMEALG